MQDAGFVLEDDAEEEEEGADADADADADACGRAADAAAGTAAIAAGSTAEGAALREERLGLETEPRVDEDDADEAVREDMEVVDEGGDARDDEAMDEDYAGEPLSGVEAAGLKGVATKGEDVADGALTEADAEAEERDALQILGWIKAEEERRASDAKLQDIDDEEDDDEDEEEEEDDDDSRASDHGGSCPLIAVEAALELADPIAVAQEATPLATVDAAEVSCGSAGPPEGAPSLESLSSTSPPFCSSPEVVPATECSSKTPPAATAALTIETAPALTTPPTASGLTYRQIQSELKKRGAKANGKKVDLIARLQHLLDLDHAREVATAAQHAVTPRTHDAPDHHIAECSASKMDDYSEMMDDSLDATQGCSSSPRSSVDGSVGTESMASPGGVVTGASMEALDGSRRPSAQRHKDGFLHESQFSRLWEQEEAVMVSHDACIREEATMISEEGSLLKSVQIGEGDFVAYAKRVDKILQRRVEMAHSLRAQVQHFLHSVAAEETISRA